MFKKYIDDEPVCSIRVHFGLIYWKIKAKPGTYDPRGQARVQDARVSLQQ